MKKGLILNEDLVFTNLKIYMMKFQCCHFITKTNKQSRHEN